MTVPSATAQFTCATTATIDVPPPGMEAKVIVRLFPEPLQTPPPLAVQETNVSDDDRMSPTLTSRAPVVRALVTEIVYVTFDPVTTGLGATVTDTAGSGRCNASCTCFRPSSAVTSGCMRSSYPFVFWNAYWRLAQSLKPVRGPMALT